MGMASDDDDEQLIYECIKSVGKTCSNEVLLLAAVGTGGLLFSIHEGSAAGALCFLTMVVAAAVRFDGLFKNYRDKAMISEPIPPALHE